MGELLLGAAVTFIFLYGILRIKQEKEKQGFSELYVVMDNQPYLEGIVRSLLGFIRHSGVSNRLIFIMESPLEESSYIAARLAENFSFINGEVSRWEASCVVAARFCGSGEHHILDLRGSHNYQESQLFIRNFLTGLRKREGYQRQKSP